MRSSRFANWLPFRLSGTAHPRFVWILLFALCASAAATHAQDVADAARQEQQRKSEQPRKQRHVYTEEDLRRAQILTPDDQLRAEARKKNSPAMPAALPDQAVDALNAPDSSVKQSLGEVARRYRQQKAEVEAQRALRISPPPFPRDVRPPALASPIHPLSLPTPVVQPKAMPVVPNAPVRRRDPFSSSAALRTVPPAPKLSAEPKSLVTPVVPRASSSAPSATMHSSAIPSVAPHQPALPNANPAARADSASPIVRSAERFAAPHVTVLPGDTLWKIAQKHLGRGARWPELVSVDAHALDPTRLLPGTQLILPASHKTRPPDASPVMTVAKGDSLWKIARLHLGHGANWHCLAQANPQLGANSRIFPGQQLRLPVACTPPPEPASRN